MVFNVRQAFKLADFAVHNPRGHETRIDHLPQVWMPFGKSLNSCHLPVEQILNDTVLTLLATLWPNVSSVHITGVVESRGMGNTAIMQGQEPLGVYQSPHSSPASQIAFQTLR